MAGVKGRSGRKDTWWTDALAIAAGLPWLMFSCAGGGQFGSVDLEFFLDLRVGCRPLHGGVFIGVPPVS